jgi:hypothetical protein
MYYIAQNGRTIDEKYTGKNLEGSGRGLSKALSRNLPEGAEETYENPQSG